MSESQVLFSRYQDGARPVRVLPDGWELLTLDGKPETKFTTAKGLLSALTGHPEGRHWSLDRYFRQGPIHGSPAPLWEPNVFDLFPPLIVTTPGISIPREQRRPAPVVHTRSGLGIDLNRRAGEVRKLLYAGFGRIMSQNGYDPEDVLQEVYKGLLVRNAGKCPWDPAKSSFGHYVHMVCGCILSNYHRKQHRIREVEQLGISSPIEEGGWADVASNTTVPALPTSMQVDTLLREEVASLTDYLRAGSTEGRLAAQILPLIVQGMSRQDMAPALGVSRTAITRAHAYLRTRTLDWKDSLKEQSGTSRTASPSFLSLDAIIAD